MNEAIVIKGAREHNLKNISLKIPRNRLTVVTGVSGSGKSSLVFDTLYAEGQRRYVESLSSYARQFLERMNKPDVDFIYGLCPAVAIEQRTSGRNPRSTVATSTEIYDYLRLLFARIGITYCFDCGHEVKRDSVASLSAYLDSLEEGSRHYLAFEPEFRDELKIQERLDILKKRGFFRIFYKNRVLDLNEKGGLPRTKKGIYVILDRLKISRGSMREKFSDSIETAFREGEGKVSIINAENFEIKNFSQFYECCGIRYEEPEPRFFSFNNPAGACPVCQGFGRIMGIDPHLVIPDESLSLMDGAVAPWRAPKFNPVFRELIRAAKNQDISLTKPYRDLSERERNMLWQGWPGFPGIDKFFQDLRDRTYKMYVRIFLSKYRGYTACTACKGSRLRRETLQVKINKMSIFDIVEMSIKKASEFFNSLEISEYHQKVGGRILKEIRDRLSFLNNVGLGYLSLNRLSSTLSGGETQRINLATSLGSALMGTLYVLDEPTIGLHPRDNGRLIQILKNLRDLGNTVVVVEHDKEMMENADRIIDMGPGAGTLGGSVCAEGSYEEILSDPNSLTGKYLSGKLIIPAPEERRLKKTGCIRIKGARENNLKNIDVEIPLKKFVVVTGVSGSGKSTLVHDILFGGIMKLKGENPSKVGQFDSIEGIKQIDEIEIVDQSPIGKSPRSNPISYVKGYELIRELFASTKQAKNKGYKPGYFSFNVPGGRCETCQGDGHVKIEMQFLADLYLECEDCHGSRFKDEVREITYHDKNIVEVLDMTASEAMEFFKDVPKLMNSLRALNDVGLGYIKLGQPSNTVSGGEAQRIKLAQHISGGRSRTRSLFIFDEPTTGLHFHDIKKLVKCFDMLIEKGNSVVIIEHNLDVINCADYLIDLGPEAGDGGGSVVACGTPEEVAGCPESHTGRYLKQYFEGLK